MSKATTKKAFILKKFNAKGKSNEEITAHFKAQFENTYNGFFGEPQTMKMLSNKIGIDRANICWYIRDMRQAGTICLVKKDYCKVTGFVSGYYTTDPDRFVSNVSPQLKLSF